MRTRMLSLILAGVAMLLPALALAQPGPGGPPCAGGPPGGPAGGRMLAAVRGLELDAAQKQKVDALQTEYTPRFTALREKMQQLRGQMATLHQQEKPAWEQAARLKGELRTTRDQMQTLKSELHTKVIALLTPAQQQKLWSEGPGRGGPGMGRHGRGGRDGHGGMGMGRGHGCGCAGGCMGPGGPGQGPPDGDWEE